MTVVAPGITDLSAVVDEVWSSFVGADQPLRRHPIPSLQPLGAAVWSGAVSTTGAWQGSITIELADPVARAITRVMLALDDAEPADDDVADAVGELVNMIGGNVKSLMPGPSTLSLPAVAAGRAVFASGAREVARLDLLWTGRPIQVTVHCPQP